MSSETASRRAVLPEATERLVQAADQLQTTHGGAAVTARVQAIVAEHDAWRDRCLNMIAAEGLMSRTSRALLDSGMAARVTEGVPGHKDDSSSPSNANAHVDELEALLIAQARRLFAVRHVEWRPLSNTMANAVVLFGLAEAGDVVMAQSMSSGANVSYHPAAVAGLRGLEVVDMPGTADFGFDLDAVRARVREHRPRIVVFGGSKILFPYPVAEIREIADEVGAYVVYDAAHVAPLIAAGRFGDPLREGAHVLVTGTHKLMGGPVGALAMTDDDEIAARLHAMTYPAFMQTRDQNKYAAAAVALAELLEFGGAYADAVIENAQALAGALDARGFAVLGRERGFTETHQVVVDAAREGAAELATRCALGNLLITRTNIHGQASIAHGTNGVRASVAYVTRQGMGPAEMEQVAELIALAARDEIDRGALQAAVAEIAGRFPAVRYSFDRS